MFYNVPLSNIVIKHDRDIRWQSCLPIAHIRRRDVDLDLWRHPDDVDKLLGGQEPYDFHTWIPGVFFATGEFALSQWSFRRTLSHCLIAAMFLSIALIFVSYFSCFFLSSWIFRLHIWPHVDFQIFGEKASNEPVKYIITLVFYTPEWLLVPVFLSVQASMTLSTAYSDDCFFNTVKSKRLPLKATSWTSFSPTTLSMELYIGNFSGQLTPRFKEDILFD